MTFTFLRNSVVSIIVGTVIGTSLWFDRTDNQVQIQDIIELKQGYVERCLATQWAYGGSLDPAPTPKQMHITGDDALSYYPSTTNLIDPPPTKKYVNVELQDGINLQSDLAYNWLGLAFRTAPPSYTHTYNEYDCDNKYILGLYKTITVNGFVDGPDPYYQGWSMYNTTYTIRDYSGGQFNYTNNDGIGMYYTKDLMFFGDYNSSLSFAHKQFYPKISAPVICEDYYFMYEPVTNNSVTITVGSLFYDRYITNIVNGVPVITTVNATNALYSAPVLTSAVTTVGWATVNKIPSYNQFIKPIDDGLLGRISPWLEGCTFLFTSLFRPSAQYTEGGECTPFAGGSLGYDSWFIDPAKYGLDNITNAAQLNYDMSALWTTLAFTNRMWYSNYTEYVAFTDNNIATNTSSETMYPTTIEQGSNAFKITQKMLTERYQAIQKLKTSVIHGFTFPSLQVGYYDNYQWMPDIPTNQFVVYGTGNSYANALAACTNYTYSTVTGAPHCYGLVRRISPTNWRIEGYKRSGYLNNLCINSNTQSKIIYYAKSFKPTWIGPYPPESVTYYNFGNPLVEDYFKIIQTDGGYAYRTNAVSNVLIGNNDPKASLPSQPTSDGKYTIKGFMVNDALMTAEWDFQYCKP